MTQKLRIYSPTLNTQYPTPNTQYLLFLAVLALPCFLAGAAHAQGPGYINPPHISPPPAFPQPPSFSQPGGFSTPAAPHFSVPQANPFPAPPSAPHFASPPEAPVMPTPTGGSGLPTPPSAVSGPAPMTLPEGNIPANQTSGLVGGSYHSTDHHFSFTPPADWAPMVPQDLGWIIANSHIQYLTGYRQQGSVTPYLLVQILPAPLGDPQSGLDSIKQADAAVTYDAGRKLVTMRMSRTIPTGDTLDMTSFAFVGRSEVICIHCYQRATEGGRYNPAFQAIADSFRFDPGYDYASRGLFTGIPGSFFGSGAVYGGIAGGIAGLLLYLIQFFSKRRSGKG